MKKFIYITIALAAVFVCGCNEYDDSGLRDRIDGFKERIEALDAKVSALNDQVAALGYLTGGNVITSMTQNAEGNYVITYKGNDNVPQTVTLATIDQMIDIPVIGVGLDDGIYYWTQIVNGETSWLLVDGEKVPVSGYTPALSVDADGYWTVNGERILDAGGNPATANAESTSLFLDVTTTPQGNLQITLGDGSVVTLQVFEVLNLSLDADPITIVASGQTSATVNYELSGAHADVALVDIAKAENLTATIDRENKKIEVALSGGDAMLIIVAYDLEDNTIVKPVFFRESTAGVTAINNAADLVAFAAAVNAGGEGQFANAVLGADIDMSSVASWTPIGNASFSWTANAVTITGNAYKGVFDGNGKSIKNLRMTTANSTAGGAYGLFGILDGATVKNLTIGAPSGDNSKLTVSASAMTDCGVIAGLNYQSTIENCVSYAEMYYNGTSGVRITMAAMAGFVFVNDAEAYIKNCTNYGAVSSINPINNTGAGATGVHIAGIAGFTSNDIGSTKMVYVESCHNRGDITAHSGRVSAIVAATNRYTEVNYCNNYANLVNNSTFSNRLGAITCNMAAGTKLYKCINYGDYYASAADARVGGIVCLIGTAGAVIDACESYGTLLSNTFGNASGSRYLGVIASHATAGDIRNCKVGGKVGSYTGGAAAATEITAANFADWVVGVKTNATVENNVFGAL